MRYRKKAVVIEAFQYDGDLKGRDGKYYVPDWAVEAYEKGIMHYKTVKFHEPPELFIDTLEGTHHVSVGDYVIRGVKGELYPCKPDIFKKTYEKAVEKEKKIDSWIPASERLPEESLNSVIGWDEYRKRCCFVQYLNGRFVLGNGEDIVDIVAWMPLPEPWKGE